MVCSLCQLCRCCDHTVAQRILPTTPTYLPQLLPIDAFHIVVNDHQPPQASGDLWLWAQREGEGARHHTTQQRLRKRGAKGQVAV